MERSKRIVGVHKGSEFDSGSQWDRVRLQTVEQVMELSDSIEDSSGYVNSKPVVKSIKRRRTLSSSVGRDSRVSED
jgi:hypothetical protein